MNAGVALMVTTEHLAQVLQRLGASYSLPSWLPPLNFTPMAA